jgi:hypothetical protein
MKVLLLRIGIDFAAALIVFTKFDIQSDQILITFSILFLQNLFVYLHLLHLFCPV